MPKKPKLTRKEKWTDRVWQEFKAGNLTRTYRDVLLTLWTFQGIGGSCWPSHETLAARVGCCVRTVSRALQMARVLCLVDWSERRVQAEWRWLRTSNAYVFGEVFGAVKPDIRPRRCHAATTGHSDGGGESTVSKKEALRRLIDETMGAPDLLAARRLAVGAKMVADMAAKYGP